MSRKNCTHCGEETHSQPQDPNHDTGYGHCYRCLNKESWYVPSHQLPNLFMWEERSRNDGPLTTDDSHGKVVELKLGGKVVNHFTSYLTKEKIIEWANKKIDNYSRPAIVNL